MGQHSYLQHHTKLLQMSGSAHDYISNIYFQRVMQYAENTNFNFHKVLICIDKFKDTMSANAAARTIQIVLKSNFDDQIEVKEVPISDGGEGFLESVQLALSYKSGTSFAQSPGTLERIEIEAVGPFANQAPRQTSFLLDHETNTAFLEVAAICGLELVPKE